MRNRDQSHSVSSLIRRFGVGVALSLASVSQLCAHPHAHAQKPPTIVIFSQPDPKAEKDEPFVDLAPYVSRNLSESGKYTPIVYKSNLQQVRDALAAGTLSAMDTMEPIRKEGAGHIARALGATELLLISGRMTKDGVAGTVEMDRLIGQQNWTLIFSESLSTYKGKGKKPSVLEGALAHAGGIVQRLIGGVNQVAASEPVKVDLRESKGTAKKGTTSKTAAAPTNNGTAKDPMKDPSKEPTKDPVSTAAKDPTPSANSGSKEPDKPVVKPTPQQQGLTVSASELLAERYRRSGDSANLILALRKAVNDKPHDARLRRDLARAYLERGWNSAARDEANRAIAAAPEDSQLHRLLGDISLAGGDHEAAVIAYQDAVRLNGKDVAAYISLGDAYMGLTRAEEAQKAYLAAVSADSASPIPHRRLARSFALKGDFESSAREMDLAKSLGTSDDGSSQSADFIEILGMAESTLRTAIARQTATRVALTNGSKTREQCFSESSEQKKRVEKLASYLEGVQAPPQLVRVTALYAQAAGIAVQYLETSLQFLESQETRKEEEALLLLKETSRQLDDAAKKLKTVTTPKAG